MSHHQNGCVKIVQKTQPFGYWRRGKQECRSSLDFSLLYRLQCEEGLLYSTSFTALKLLLKYFDCNPINTTTGQRIIDIEDDLPTSPGMVSSVLILTTIYGLTGLVLHYFCAINYVEGVEVLLQVH